MSSSNVLCSTLVELLLAMEHLLQELDAEQLACGGPQTSQQS